jgi:glucose 1-dehydrogenase/3-oxoacyl-[acyl-carrier protein] reductase
MTTKHAGRTAVVTGAGTGIGRAISVRLAREGARVACIDVNHDRACETVEIITATGGEARPYTADVRNRDQVHAALAESVALFGPLHYLVNNAGVVTMTSLEQLSDDEWDQVVDVNMKGPFIVTQLAAEHLVHDGHGSVVNITTIEADVIVSSRGFCQPHYNASKGGLKMLTKALAVELSRHQIRVNAVAPGPVLTGFIPGVDPENLEVPESILSRLLIPRLGQPDDIAAAVSFLLSDEAAYITGTQLVVDGGWTVR